MSPAPVVAAQRVPAGHAEFVRYAYPPNELGYCGGRDAGALLRSQSAQEIEMHARQFDGTWPYLRAIADAAALVDPLDADVVHSYWVGGALLDRVDAAVLLAGLHSAFSGQRTGLLAELPDATGVLAHHSFHVFAVYPWVGFLDNANANANATATALHVLQNCRIRWGRVVSVPDDHALVSCRPLTFDAGVLALGAAVTERIRWRRAEVALIDPPAPGAVVAAHWDWLCGNLGEADAAALANATQSTLDVVNTSRDRQRPKPINDSTRRRGEVKENLMNIPDEQRSEEPQDERGAPGSRDTGSDQPSGGPVERPSGTYEGDEGAPAHDAPGGPQTPGSAKTEQPPADVKPAVPPYEGRQTVAKPEDEHTGDQGARDRGAVKPTSDTEGGS